MSAHTAYVVFNPLAGHGRHDAIEAALARALADAGWSYEIYRVTGQESLPELIRSALKQDYDVFVAAGGDGTVSAVAAGLANSGKPLGILPVGTTNVLAIELGIPLRLGAALDLLTGKHRRRDMDALQMEGRYLLVGLSIGLLPIIARETPIEEKHRLGFFAYLWTGLKELGRLNTRTFELSVDGHEDRLRAAELVVANGATFDAAMRRFGLRGTPVEGRIVVYAVRALTPLCLIALLWQRITGQAPTRAPIRQWTAQQYVKIRTEAPADVQGDGDVVAQTPVDVRLAPEAVQILVPADGQP
ncbi:MAG: diacylglycerol/lipid kinase family protein [Anaerolineae bacterium]|jgi:diacylglycerol kinase family enzyme